MATGILKRLLSKQITIQRDSNCVVDLVTISATVTIDRQPGKAGILRVTISDATAGTGTVTITGTVEGTPGSTEVLTFTGNGSKITTSKFSAITSVTTTELADEADVGNIEIAVTTGGGQPILQRFTVANLVPSRIYEFGAPGTLKTIIPGQEADAFRRLIIEVPTTWDLRTEDKIVDGAVTYEVTSSPSVKHTRRDAHHLEATIREV